MEALREAKVKLARQTLSHTSVNGVEYSRIDSQRINEDIKNWQAQLEMAKRAAGDYSGASVRWVG